MTITPSSNTKTIARNSLWLAVERVVDFVTAMFTSIVMARAFGPAVLGHLTFFIWLTNTAGRLGGLGIAQSTSKYGAEYFGAGRLGLVRTIFDTTLRLQIAAAVFIAGVGVTVVMFTGDPNYRLLASLLILSVVPGLINSIPSHLNNAAEKVVGNVPGTLVSAGIYVASVAATVYFGWGLIGIGVGVLTMRTGEMIVRLAPAMAWMRRIPREPLPDDLKRKMMNFSGQGFVLLLLAGVWDRSEIFFLREFNADVRQVSFFSLAFGTTQNILAILEVFAHGVGVSLVAQYGRDRSRLGPMVSGAIRYLTLLGLPLLMGLAALSSPMITLMYGSEYLPAIPVLAVTALLAIPRVFLVPVHQALRAAEHQGFILRWSLLTAALNIALDLLLIPSFGAMGAACANGIAQTFAVVGPCVKATRVFEIKLPLRFFGGVATCAVAMAAIVVVIASNLPPLLAIPLGVTTGALVFLLVLRWVGVLEQEDRTRLTQLRRQFPSPLRRGFDSCLQWLMPLPRPNKTMISEA